MRFDAAGPRSPLNIVAIRDEGAAGQRVRGLVVVGKESGTRSLDCNRAASGFEGAGIIEVRTADVDDEVGARVRIDGAGIHQSHYAVAVVSRALNRLLVR